MERKDFSDNAVQVNVIDHPLVALILLQQKRFVREKMTNHDVLESHVARNLFQGQKDFFAF